jgi:hypothetical protein
MTWTDPLADDSPAALLVFYGPMFTLWAIVAFKATRRSGRLWDGIGAGAAVACVTFLVFYALNLVRINLFLDVVSQRTDWQNLIVRFQASGFQSLRAYVNYEYLTGAPFKIGFAAGVGTVMGLIGGFAGTPAALRRRTA